jgi:hypothetical protein
VGKGKNKKGKKVAAPKANIQELNASRDGGQIALRGYSYQFLYSCYLILSSSSPNISFQLEGIEDIDYIKQENDSSDITHIQLKYSINKQDASFLAGVLKNFLEAYLIDPARKFQLVYDFPVATGNLSKLFFSNLDEKSRIYWKQVISDIRCNNPSWNWSLYDFDQFISRLSFKKVEKSALAAAIEKALVQTYEITTDNISLFANSIKILCFEKMEQRSYVTKAEVDAQIQSVRIDISKGPQNPAHSWIRKLDYTKAGLDGGRSFYEGKKATPEDIVSGVPVERPGLEKEVIYSVGENTVTVMKASSGQGKTTLALRAAYLLRDEYIPYQLLCCDEVKELGNIVQYFKARIQLGEKVLILIDNLDQHFCQWNRLTSLLQSELRCHYKLIVTSREIDWYHYSGDLSNIQSVNVIKPVLEEKEAIEMFRRFKEAKQLHPSITDWRGAWKKVAEKQLLIEYVYLLTHGEMMAERIGTQISEIGRSSSGRAKCEILRKVCFADICGVRLSVVNLCSNETEDSGSDFGELLKSMESEFLVHVNEESGYIEGLHPIRSKHVVERLHEFLPIDNTAISVMKMADKADLPILFSHLPEFTLNKETFFRDAVDSLWDEKDLSNYTSAIQGLFSGCVMQYFLSNRAAFDDADAHGGLFLISTEMCPFAVFEDFGVSMDTLDKMRETFPDNKNIEYLCRLRERIPTCRLQETYVYVFCDCLYRKLCTLRFDGIKDIMSYASISEWIYNINPEWNVSVGFSLDDLWSKPEKLTLECISTLMYLSYCGNRKKYMEFVERNLKSILTYLKQWTRSHRVFIDSEKNAIHIEYILRLHNIKTGNEQSVSRLKLLCKALPIFDLYCADALKPTVDLLAAYPVPDDAHKEMSIRNIVIMFHQNLTSLWNKTIMSNYEFDTVTEWLNYWFDVREHICLLADKCCACIYKLLSGKTLGGLAGEVDKLREDFALITTGEKRYPKEDRPFEEKATVPERLGKIKNKYFQSIQNFMNQFAGFLAKEEQKQRLAMVNLITAQSSLVTMQNYFAEIAIDFGFQERQMVLCVMETQNIERLIMCCRYYQAHSPNKYFDKYQIRNWYDGYCRDERKIAEEGFLALKSKYLIHFPDKIYTIDMLRYYPIIVDNFDMASESNLTEWLLGCIAFSDAPFDYLVILSANEFEEINSAALQFPRQMLVDVKKAIESENYSSLDKLLHPYPVDVTAQMLDCFSEKYDLPEKKVTDVDEFPIGDIAEELWIYSKSVELLTEPEDACYLADQTQDIQPNIAEMLRLLKNKLPFKDVDWLIEICDNVFSGEKFDDIMFNNVIEHFIQKKIEQ